MEWFIAWLPAIVIALYLAIVLYIGIFAFRRGRETGEDFFLASRSIGGIVFFLSLFATNMTAFAILGSSGMAYKIGIGVFGMMATSSALVIPLTLFFIGTRLWALGKRFGHMTQVAFFRDRWECSFIGSIIFLVTAGMLLPYLIISIDGGGTILTSLTDGKIPYALGGLIVTLIVMATVFFGGMRGAVWVNVLQTLLFISFGIVAFTAIGKHLPGGFPGTVQSILDNDKPAASAAVPAGSAAKPEAASAITATNAKPVAAAPQKPAMARPATLLDRERIPWQVFLSFMLIPLSSIMFPHMSIMCFTAKRVTAFKKTVILYPLCIAAIWLPCVFLGALGPSQKAVKERVSANSELLKVWVETGGHASEEGKRPDDDLVALNTALEAAGKSGKGAQVMLDKVKTKKLDAKEAASRFGSAKAPAVQSAWAAIKDQPELLKTWINTGGQAAEPGKKPNPKLVALNKAVNLTARTGAAAQALLDDIYAKKLDTIQAVRRLDAISSPPIQKAWAKVASSNSDSVLLEMLKDALQGPKLRILFGLLAAGIISAVMGSDCHQILGLSTMFTKDVFTYYGGGKRMGEKSVVHMGRAFIVIINAVAYIIALGRPPIFDLAVTYAFSGFAALAPMMIAALFWKRSTKWGALLCTLWVGTCVGFMVYAEGFHHFKPEQILCHVGDWNILFMSTAGKLSFMGMMPAAGHPFVGFSAVVPMVLGSLVLMVVGSLITPRPSQATIDKYFPGRANAGSLAMAG
jgi:Na+/proline symporter